MEIAANRGAASLFCSALTSSGVLASDADAPDLVDAAGSASDFGIALQNLFAGSQRSDFFRSNFNSFAQSSDSDQPTGPAVADANTNASPTIALPALDCSSTSSKSKSPLPAPNVNSIDYAQSGLQNQTAPAATPTDDSDPSLDPDSNTPTCSTEVPNAEAARTSPPQPNLSLAQLSTGLVREISQSDAQTSSPIDSAPSSTPSQAPIPKSTSIRSHAYFGAAHAIEYSRIAEKHIAARAAAHIDDPRRVASTGAGNLCVDAVAVVPVARNQQSGASSTSGRAEDPAHPATTIRTQKGPSTTSRDGGVHESGKTNPISTGGFKARQSEPQRAHSSLSLSANPPVAGPPAVDPVDRAPSASHKAAPDTQKSPAATTTSPAQSQSQLTSAASAQKINSDFSPTPSAPRLHSKSECGGHQPAQAPTAAVRDGLTVRPANRIAASPLPVRRADAMAPADANRATPLTRTSGASTSSARSISAKPVSNVSEAGGSRHSASRSHTSQERSFDSSLNRTPAEAPATPADNRVVASAGSVAKQSASSEPVAGAIASSGGFVRTPTSTAVAKPSASPKPVAGAIASSGGFVGTSISTSSAAGVAERQPHRALIATTREQVSTRGAASFGLHSEPKDDARERAPIPSDLAVTADYAPISAPDAVAKPSPLPTEKPGSDVENPASDAPGEQGLAQVSRPAKWDARNSAPNSVANIHLPNESRAVILHCEASPLPRAQTTTVLPVILRSEASQAPRAQTTTASAAYFSIGDSKRFPASPRQPNEADARASSTDPVAPSPTSSNFATGQSNDRTRPANSEHPIAADIREDALRIDAQKPCDTPAALKAPIPRMSQQTVQAPVVSGNLGDPGTPKGTPPAANRHVVDIVPIPAVHETSALYRAPAIVAKIRVPIDNSATAHVTIRQRLSEVDVKVVAPTNASAHAIGRELGSLGRALSNEGMKLRSAEVTSNQSGGPGGSGGSHSGSSSEQSGRRGRNDQKTQDLFVLEEANR